MGASGITISQKARFGVCLVKSVPSAIAFVGSPFCVAIGVEVLGRVRQEEEKTKNMVSLGLLLKRINVRCGRLLHACIGETSWCLSTL